MAQFGGFDPTEEEIAAYIDHTVRGGKVLAARDDANRLMQAKRNLDMTIKMWIEDLSSGLLRLDELQRDPAFAHPWAQRMLETVGKRAGR